MKTIHNFSLKQKNVLLRVDLNVPVTEGIITAKSRIDSIKLELSNKLDIGFTRMFYY